MEHVRQAEQKDYKAINALAEGLGYESVDDQIALSRLIILLKSENDQVWVYERDKELVGWIHTFIAFRLASKAFLEIGGLVVNAKHRRSGIGSKLVHFVIDDADKKGLQVRVRCNISREGTLNFYKSLGFQSLKSQNILEIESKPYPRNV